VDEHDRRVAAAYFCAVGVTLLIGGWPAEA
jgi:hypothetical protein